MADFLEAGTELAALIWVATQIINHNQPLGQFVYVQQMVGRALSSANGFISQLSTIDEDVANLFDYQKFMNLPAALRQGKAQASMPRNIEFKDVSFRYPTSDSNVLQHVSFEFRAGQHIAIVGENGAGKSTLIKLLTGLYNPTEGVVLVNNQSLSDIEIESWHRQLSVLQQEFERYTFTDIKNNVYFGNVNQPLSKEKLQLALEGAEAQTFINKLPQKINTYPSTWMEDEEGNKGTELSGGQWQRIAIARNFYRDAPVIILDEPTSAIDALAEAKIFKRLFAKTNEKTVITVSHRLSTVARADNIIVLKDGKIVESGTHSKLVENNGEYRRIFAEQLEEKLSSN
jgi:ATP-binding cassette subfamily B protein/ATP-binding cassette subfamily C protein